MNQLQSDLEVSDLYENMASRKNVLSRALPRTLVDKIGLDVLMQRLPEQVSIFAVGLACRPWLIGQYQRAVWSAWVSSNYIYECSMAAGNVDFFHFFSKLSQ